MLKKQIDQIIVNSLPFYERLLYFKPIRKRQTQQKISSYFDYWKNEIIKDEILYKKRLKKDSLNTTKQIFLTNFEKLNIKLKDYPWAKLLKIIFRQQKQKVKSNPNTPGNIPFVEVLAPFIQSYEETIAKNKNLNLLSPEANYSLTMLLWKRLSDTASQTIQFEFELFKKTTSSPRSKTSSDQYKAFTKMLLDNYFSFFQEYPVLARLMSTITFNHINFSNEFLNRLSKDKEHLTKLFQCHGKVLQIGTGLSDFHDQGRCVLTITFKNKVKLVYKPRDLTTEKCFYNFQEEINKKLNNNIFLPITILSKKNYGWVEYVVTRECDSKIEIDRYYYNAGCLTCLLHLLEGSDFHSENIIAQGPHPVAIDLEMVLYHRLYESTKKLIEEDQKYVNFSTTVIRTGLIPNWKIDEQGNSYDISGFGSIGTVPVRSIKWEHINTDLMCFSYKVDTKTSTSNLPKLIGKTELLFDNTNQFIIGFEEFYRFAIANKKYLATYIQKKFNFLRIRYANRFTKIYDSLIRQLHHPKYMRSGLGRSFKIDLLSKAYLQQRSIQQFWPLLSWEHAALEEMDIPKAYSFSNSIDLYSSGKCILKKCFAQSSIRKTIEKIEGLSEDTLLIEKDVILFSITSQNIDRTPNSTFTNSSRNLELVTKSKNYSDIALSIGENLIKNSFNTKKGSLYWMGMNFSPKYGNSSYLPLDNSLYSGVGGVGIFFSALSKIEPVFEEYCYQTFYPSLELITKKKLARFSGISSDFMGINGITSLLYSLTHAQKINPNLQFTSQLSSLCGHIKRSDILSSTRSDIVNGTSGLLLCLLKYFEFSKSDSVLEKAIWCGKAICNQSITIGDDLTGWRYDGKLLGGFSHGCSGIAYALLRLYDLTKEDIFRNKALQAINYENSLFDEKEKNWKDIRYSSHAKTHYYNAWCHGSLGIGLGRMGCNQVYSGPDICRDIERSAELNNNEFTYPVDHICCGNTGSLEFSIQYSKLPGNVGSRQISTFKADKLVTRAMNDKHFKLYFNNNFLNFSFFRGLSGIAYSLLRMDDPTLDAVSILE